MTKDKDAILKNFFNPVNEGLDHVQENRKARADQEHKLAQLLKGEELKQQTMAKQLQMAQDTHKQYGGRRAVNVEGVSIGGPENPANFMPRLTPAQEAAEKVAGKHVEDWVSAGGKPAAEKDIEALNDVSKGLETRDNYDRVVGGALSGWPTLMGLLAPTEKGRRDKAHNTIEDSIRKTDANPTEKQILQKMGQIYDPSSDNASNADRIAQFQKEQRAKFDQREQGAQNYGRTGYVTLGGEIQPPAAPSLAETPRQKLQRLRQEKAKRGQ